MMSDGPVREPRAPARVCNRVNHVSELQLAGALPAWLEHPTPPCCALDIAESIPARRALLGTIANAMHVDYSTVWRIARRAVEKLRAMGDDLRELMPDSPGPIVTTPGTDLHAGYNNLRRRGLVEQVDGAWIATAAGAAAVLWCNESAQ